MTVVVTAVATCCHCKGTWMLERLQKWNENLPKYGIEAVGVLKKSKVIVNAAPCRVLRWLACVPMT